MLRMTRKKTKIKIKIKIKKNTHKSSLIKKKRTMLSKESRMSCRELASNLPMVEVTRSTCQMLMSSIMVAARRNPARSLIKKIITQVNQILRMSSKRVSTTVFMKSPLTFRMLITIQIRIRLLRARRAHSIP